MKFCTIIGARPQFIKAMALSHEVSKHGNVDEVLIHTGQHFDKNMSDVFFEELGIPEPVYNLGIAGGSHGQNTGQMIIEIEKVLIAQNPQWIVLYGDTNSTLAGAIAASKLGIKIAHIEAGLRSYNMDMPEEINRILTDRISSLLFTPTTQARKNLESEGVKQSQIIEVGDIMYDTMLLWQDKLPSRKELLEKFNLSDEPYILATVHRQENTDNHEKLKAIFSGFEQSGKQIVLPLHPRTKNSLEAAQISISENIKIIPPAGYIDMLAFQRHADLIATDSGGVQKEAYFNKTPCVTLRDETEWVELIDAGVNTLVKTNSDDIRVALCTNYDHIEWSKVQGLYGSGNTAELIIKALQEATSEQS